MWIVLSLVAGALVVLVVANLSSSAKKIEHRIEHLYRTGDPEFVRSMGALLGPGIVAGNRVRALCNGDEIFPAMLDAIAGAQADDLLRDLHLLVGVDRPGVRRRLERAGPGRREGPRGARLGGLGQDGRVDARGDEGCRRRGGAVPPAALVQPRPAQQPDPPQAAGRGRRDRLHRRRRHRGQLAGQRPGPGALARLAFPDRGPGGGADAGRVHGQLDGDVRRGAARRGLLPRAGAGGPARRRRSSRARPTTPARACG